MKLEEKLDCLKTLIQQKDYLEGQGLGNEVNIRILCYEPKDEMIVRHFTESLLESDLPCRVIEFNIYKEFIAKCDELGILRTIPMMEKRVGSEKLLEKIEKTIDIDDIVERLSTRIGNDRYEVLLIDGVGDAFPFIRVHKLLEKLQQKYSSLPLIVLYPGTFDGLTLKLFNKLKTNNYYRAFNVI